MRIIKFMVLLVVFTGNAAAQTFELPSCPAPGDDRFWFGDDCCITPNGTFSTPTLGEEDGIGMTAQWASITDCGVAVEEELEITIRMKSTLPASLTAGQGLIACDDVLFQITATNAGGTLAFTIGNSLTSQGRRNWLMGKYSRTWETNDENGNRVQRYRYLIDGEATFSTPLHPLVPACEAAETTVMMHGYIDLSCSPGSPGSEDPPMPPTPPILNASLVLTHYDGCQSHLDTPLNLHRIPGSPPSKHIGTSYHLVAPNDFDFSAALLNPATDLTIINGSLDAVRSTVSRTTVARIGSTGGTPVGLGPQCLTESPLTLVNALYSYSDCVCATNPELPSYVHQNISGQTNCTTGTSWTSTPIVPEIPTGFFQLHLGAWRPTARFDVRDVYPQPILGTIAYLDQCDTVLNRAEDWHIVFGVNTYYSQDTSSLNPNHNVPWLFVGGNATRLTDTLMDFGNSVDGLDRNIVGSPSYMNIVWMISR